jgi:hypothetical protein
MASFNNWSNTMLRQDWGFDYMAAKLGNVFKTPADHGVRPNVTRTMKQPAGFPDSQAAFG